MGLLKKWFSGSQSEATSSKALQKALVAYQSGDYATAFAEFTTLAEAGDAEAQDNLGIMYYNGEGVKQDYKEAVKWTEMAAEAGLTIAQYNLGLMHKNGEGVKKDDVEAAEWLRRAAVAGNTDAQKDLLLIYEEGKGVPKDIGADFEKGKEAFEEGKYDIAVAELTPFAEAGNTLAQNALGCMYDEGVGILQDYKEAVMWWRLAADVGYVGAQNNMGWAYSKGRGVPQNDVEAVRWYRLAAEAGDATAQFNLGAKYASGAGVKHDNRLAYMWFNLAAGQGHEEAPSVRDEATEYMTPEQIIEAQEMSRECLKQNYKNC